MRGPLYLICWAAVAVAVRATNPEEINFNRQQQHFLEPVDVAADRETIAYLLPRLAAKYRPNGDWTDVSDPRFYVLTEMDNDDGYDVQSKTKNIRNKRYNYESTSPRQTRYGPSLSIDAPIQSLRNLYAKERMRQRVEANRKFLIDLAKSQ